MWNPSDALQRKLRAGAAVLALALSGPVLAQEPPAPPAPPAEAPAPAAPSEARQDLRRVLERSYEVLPLHNGVVLRPRKERLGVRTIEVSGDTIAVNGERVTEGVLRAWLAADAEPVLRLYRLPPRERQALFGLQSGNGDLPAEVATEQPEGETEIAAEGELPAEAPESPETPEEPEVPAETAEEPDFPSSTSGSRINFGGDIVIAKDELAEEAVAVVGSVRVEGEVSRDVTAVGGSVVVNGRVGGNVHAVGGGVRLGPKAVVDGDVSSVGGTIVRAEGSQIHGKTSEVSSHPSGGDWEDVDISFHPWSPFLSDTMDLYWHLVWIGLLALLVCLCLLVARRPMERVEYHVRTEPWVAGLVGFAAQLLFVPLFLIVTFLLLITIVGCALFALYPFLFIALLLAVLLGYAAVAHQFGRFLEERFGRRFGSPYAVALVGVVSLGLMSLLGRLIGLGGGVLDFLAFTLMAFGFVVQYVAVTIGMGAVLQARFGGTRGGTVPASALPPPPPPDPAPAPYDPVLDEPGLDRPGGVS